jgi:hypothetical protein
MNFIYKGGGWGIAWLYFCNIGLHWTADGMTLHCTNLYYKICGATVQADCQWHVLSWYTQTVLHYWYLWSLWLEPMNRGDNFCPRGSCQWYVRGGGEGKRRILIGQSVPPTPFGMAFGRRKLSPQAPRSLLPVIWKIIETFGKYLKTAPAILCFLCKDAVIMNCVYTVYNIDLENKFLPKVLQNNWNPRCKKLFSFRFSVVLFTKWQPGDSPFFP